MTTTHFHPLIPAATTLLGPGAKATLRTRTAPAGRQPAAPAALWQQSLRVNEGRSLIERLACLLLILFTAAALAYGALVTIRTFQGDHLRQAVAKIAHQGTR